MKLAERFQLLDFAYAHRGYWAEDGAPENSLEAFRAAADARLGIELDVRPCADGTPVCFHDPLLDRMTNATGLVHERSSTDLQDCQLPNSEPVPLFSDVLDVWPADLPMLVEMKIDGTTNPAAFTVAVANMVRTHSGPAAVMSFSEDAVAAIPPEIMRGQLVAPRSMIGSDRFDKCVARALSRKVDYLALHISDAEAGAEPPLPVACWTVTELRERNTLQALGMAEIFEHLPVPLAAR